MAHGLFSAPGTPILDTTGLQSSDRVEVHNSVPIVDGQLYFTRLVPGAPVMQNGRHADFLSVADGVVLPVARLVRGYAGQVVDRSHSGLSSTVTLTLFED